VFLFSLIMTVLCLIHVVWWVTTWLSTISWEPDNPSSCSGLGCYEVFSCFGMKDTTHNIREPLVTLSGALLFPLGAAGAYWENQRWVRVLAVYLTASALLHYGLIVFDSVYLGTCRAFSKDIVELVLTNRVRIPPSLMSEATRRSLEHLSTYTFQEVGSLVVSGNSEILTEYYVFALLWATVLLWAANVARCLGVCMERGLHGIGVNYGLDFFDELAKREAQREDLTKQRRSEMLMRSRFVQDASAAVPRGPDQGGAYGATGDAGADARGG